MKKGIRKIISIISILTMIFQMVMPIIPGLNSKVFAVENIDLEQEEISRNYEIKEEETWDVSANGDGSVIAKWTLKDRTLRISGTGETKDWKYNSKEDWHNTQYTSLIENVIIENGITSIGSYAFYRCSSLESIEIPEGVASINEGAFSGCSSLESITIPSSVTSIVDGAFPGCSSLRSINVDINNKNYTSESGILFNKGKRELVTYPAGKKDIKEYVIPNSVTSIGSDAFEGCSSLKDIDIPSSVTRIGSSAFSGCSSLESINIPSSVTSIGIYAFYGCSSLKDINISEEVTSIERYTFYKCSSLESIEIPEGVTSIESYAFYICSSLESINIPNSVTSIVSSAFSECSSLTSINVDEGNEKYTSEDGILFDKAKSKIVEYPAGKKDIKEYTIPNTVTSIESGAFEDCNSLESITIPSSVTSIGSNAINKTTIIYTKLNSEGHRYAEESGQGYILEGEETENTEEISRNYEIKEEETWDVSANGDGSVIAKWTLKDRTLRISGTGEMKDWKDNSKEDWHNTQHTSLIENVIVEEGVTSIGDYAFYECSSLKSISIPNSVANIGWYAFLGCSSLGSITIPQSVTSIGSGVFYECSSLTSINIPSSITSIGWYAFYRCSSLESITIPEGVTSIEDGAFYRCSSLKSISIPNSVTSIGSYAFRGCSSLESINVDKNNKNYISEDGILFDKGKTKMVAYPAGKKDIKEYVISSSVTSVESYAFEGCNSLESVNIPEGVTSIGSQAFSGCSSLESIDIPSSVTSIGNYAFYECSSLESITIPEGVTSIEDDAFNKCAKLVIYTNSNSEGHRYAEEGEQGYILIYEPGDINGNGFVDITDFLMLKRHLVAGNRTEWILTGNRLLAADMNENGTVDITDLLLLKKVIVENI